MSWKTTAVLGVVAALLLGAIFFLKARESADDDRRADLLQGWNVDAIEAISIQPPGGVEITLRRAGMGWVLSKPRQWNASEHLVNRMLTSFFAARQSIVYKPGDRDYDLGRMGLTQPRLIVTLEGAGKKRTFRFGSEGILQKGEVWLQIEGEPNVYVTTKEAFNDFQVDVHQLRSKQLASFEPHRVKRIVLTERFHGQAEKRDRDGNVIQPAQFVYEASELEKREKNPAGWFLVKPEERLDDTQVLALIAGLRGIFVVDFVANSGLKEKGLEEPRLKIELDFGDSKTVFRLGGDVPEKKGHTYLWVEGSEDVAIVDQAKYLDPLPATRNSLRSRRIIFWTEEQTKEIQIEGRDLGRIVLKPEKVKVSSPQMVGETVEWVPEGFKEKDYEREQSTLFARYLYSLMLRDSKSWLGVQPIDPKQYGLDPPMLSIKFVLEGGDRTLLFGIKAEGATEDYIMKKAWHDEYYWAPGEYVRIVKRMELNFRKLEMLSVPRDSIVGFWFEDRRRKELWQIARDGKGQPWRFTDDENVREKREVDNDGKVVELINRSNFIKAKQFIGKDDEVLKQFELDQNPAYRFWVITGRTEADRKCLWISRNLGKTRAPIHYARFEGDNVVFELELELLDALIDGVDKKPVPRDNH